MTILEAIILGIVEGITEYLPISSTGHLIIVSALLGLDEPGTQKQAINAFNIVIQGGAILAVVGVFWKRVKTMILGVLGRNPQGFKLAMNLFIAFLPAAVLGVLLNPFIEKHLFYPGPVVGALAVGGVVMVLLTPWQRRHFRDDENGESTDAMHYVDIERLTWRRALIIGLLQCVAMWPGTSRSMMTIVGGMLVGLRPKQAAEFSFLLGLPTLGGACVYKAMQSFRADGPDLIAELGAAPLLVGLLVATISAALAVKWLVGYLGRHGVAAFGWYRLALSAVLGVMIWRGVLTIAPETEDHAASDAAVVDPDGAARAAQSPDGSS